MNDYLINAQEFTLEYVRIVSALAQPIDLKEILMEFNYYEDLFKNTVTGNIVINDSNNLISRLFLNGNEYLLVKFNKPTYDSPIERSFRIFSIGKRINTTHTNESYIINFCSEELILSEQYRVSKSYRNKKVSEMVSHICESFLKINPNKMGVIEETKNTLNLVVPNSKPFEAINWLANYGLSKETNTNNSTYVFYENRNGFHFNSLQSMYSKPVSATYEYSAKNLPSGDDGRVRDIVKEFRNVLTYEIVNHFDSLNSQMNGAYANKLIGLDLINQNYNEFIFDYSKYFDKAKKLNDNPLITNPINRFGDAPYETPSGALRLVTSLKLQSQNKYVKSKGVVIKDNEIENFVTHRMAQITQLMTTRVRITVPGDISLKVGDTIIFNLPIAGLDAEQGKPLDKLYSGKYLITALRHKADMSGTFVTILEICKESVPNRIPDFDNTLDAFKKLRED